MTRLGMKKRWLGAKPCRYCGRRVIDTGRYSKWYDPKAKTAVCSKCWHKRQRNA